MLRKRISISLMINWTSVSAEHTKNYWIKKTLLIKIESFRIVRKIGFCQLLGIILTKVANENTYVGGIKKYATGY